MLLSILLGLLLLLLLLLFLLLLLLFLLLLLLLLFLLLLLLLLFLLLLLLLLFLLLLLLLLFLLLLLLLLLVLLLLLLLMFVLLFFIFFSSSRSFLSFSSGSGSGPRSGWGPKPGIAACSLCPLSSFFCCPFLPFLSFCSKQWTRKRCNRCLQTNLSHKDLIQGKHRIERTNKIFPSNAWKHKYKWYCAIDPTSPPKKNTKVAEGTLADWCDKCFSLRFVRSAEALLADLGTFRWSYCFKVIWMRAIVLEAAALNSQSSQIHK